MNDKSKWRHPNADVLARYWLGENAGIEVCNTLNERMWNSIACPAGLAENKYRDKPDPRDQLKVDDLILVRMRGAYRWKPRHFAEKLPGAYGVRCWLDGKTSWTTDRATDWPEWKLPEDEN